jgi:hypothetical protein
MKNGERRGKCGRRETLHHVWSYLRSSHPQPSISPFPSDRLPSRLISPTPHNPLPRSLSFHLFALIRSYDLTTFHVIHPMSFILSHLAIIRHQHSSIDITHHIPCLVFTPPTPWIDPQPTHCRAISSCCCALRPTPCTRSSLYSPNSVHGEVEDTFVDDRLRTFGCLDASLRAPTKSSTTSMLRTSSSRHAPLPNLNF